MIKFEEFIDYEASGPATHQLNEFFKEHDGKFKYIDVKYSTVLNKDGEVVTSILLVYEVKQHLL